jgi:hypothetical protein
MSAVSILLIVLGAIVFAALVLIAVALFSPLVFTIDSANRRLRVRWLAALEYSRPLPGGEGEAGMSIMGRPVGPPAQRTEQKRVRAKAAARKPRKRRPRVARFLRRCLREPAIWRAVSAKLRELWRVARRSARVTRREFSVSLPDPAWNGMLVGWLASVGGWGSAIRMNFLGRNEVFLEIRLYPYRIAAALLLFPVGLPYRALYRAWRASAAAVSG